MFANRLSQTNSTQIKVKLTMNMSLYYLNGELNLGSVTIL